MSYGNIEPDVLGLGHWHKKAFHFLDQLGDFEGVDVQCEQFRIHLLEIDDVVDDVVLQTK